MLTCDAPFSNQFMQLGLLACTTICLTLRAKGWKKAGVTDVVSGLKKLPPQNPFEDLDVYEHCGL